MRRNLLVSLEGNIGSGKSTLLAKVSAARPPITILPEPVELWTAPLELLHGRSMLQSYYEDGEANSFAFQMYVLKTRLDQVLDVPPGQAILSERCLSSHDLIFAAGARSRGSIGDVQWVAYRGWVESVTRISGEAGPDAVVYLRTSPAVCASRRRLRNCCAEADLPDVLLEDLHVIHDVYVKELSDRGLPVLVIDGDVDDPLVVGSIVSFVEGLLPTEKVTLV